MRELQIVIPSYRRMPRQATLHYIPTEWMERTTLVVDEYDNSLKDLYELYGAKILVHPSEIKTISQPAPAGD